MRAFNDNQYESRKFMANGPKKELWGSEHQHSLRFHNFADIINDEQNLYFWLKGDDKFVTLSVIKFISVLVKS